MNNKIKKYKVGIDSETYAISLVEDPAMEIELVYMSKEEEKKVEVCLESDEKHLVYSAVLIPDKPIYRLTEDGTEFYLEFTKESIEKMAQDFMLNYRQKDITLEHAEEATEVSVVESWIKYSPTMDKSVALGFDSELPIGTWFAGMKINNIETWDKIKSGELKGYSVEALIDLEEFEFTKTKEHMNTNFFERMKQAFKEALKEEKMSAEENAPIEEIKNSMKDIDKDIKVEEIKLEAETVTETKVEETIAETPIVEQPIVEEPIAEQPIVEEPKAEEPKVEEPIVEQHNPLEEVVNNLKTELETLRKMNESLQTKIDDLNKQPSAKPINTNSGNNGTTFQSWREQLKNML